MNHCKEEESRQGKRTSDISLHVCIFATRILTGLQQIKKGLSFTAVDRRGLHISRSIKELAGSKALECIRWCDALRVLISTRGKPGPTLRLRIRGLGTGSVRDRVARVTGIYCT